MRPSMLLILLFAFAGIANAQTLYVPSGTSGIANSNNTNVGIGVASPGAKLHVGGDIRGAGSNGALRISTLSGYLEVGAVNSSFTHFYTDLPKYFFNKPIYTEGGKFSSYDVANLELQTNGTTRMTLLSSNGYVGIGTGSPSAKLTINNTSAVQYDNTVRINSYNTADHWPLLVQSNTLNNSGFVSNATQDMHLHLRDRSGNANVQFHSLGYSWLNGGYFGIGTTTPASKLDIVNANAFNTTEASSGQDNITLSMSGNPSANTFFGGIAWKNGGRRRAGIAAVQETNNQGSADIDFVGLAFFSRGIDGPGPMDESMRISHSGNVGIGTTSPAAKLHVAGHMILEQSGTADPRLYTGTGSSDLNKYFLLLNTPTNPSASGLKAGGVLIADDFGYAQPADNNLIVKGNVGIGTNNPSTKLTINQNSSTAYQNCVRVNSYNTADHWPLLVTSNNNNISGFVSSSAQDIYMHLRESTGTANVQLHSEGTSWLNGGNVGIGTTTPDEKLAVNGTVHAKEVKVDLVGWPDYVFEDEYKLPSLSETEKFIKENKHLPGVPAADEIEANGLKLGEMNAILLKKIEEITLLMIEQNKLLQSQGSQIADQAREIEYLKNQVEANKK